MNLLVRLILIGVIGMSFQVRKAERKQVKLRIGISSMSGGGKTYSALWLAYGMTGDWGKIFVIDSENDSASLYAHLGEFNVVNLEAPYTPERYIEAIKTCEEAGAAVIIVDSVSQEWEGPGGCLEIQTKLGGKYQDWAKITPRHKAFIDAILMSKSHIITTARRKTDYDMTKNSNGKTVVTKVGLKEIQREGFEYELTINFALQLPSHYAVAEKDRTGLFMDRPEFLITERTGKEIMEWCNSGSIPTEVFYDQGIVEHKIQLGHICKEFGVVDVSKMIDISAQLTGKCPLDNLKKATSELVNV